MPGVNSETTRRMPGKRVGGFLYIHKSAVDLLEPADRATIASAAALLSAIDWNVAKVCGPKISLLLYEDFDDVAFPALLQSCTFNPTSGAIEVHDYRRRANPPILHRKETLLRPDDHRVPRFAALTRQAEDHGLFADTKTIGTRKRWNELIAKGGLVLRGHSLAKAHETAVKVERYRTALVRRDLSQPIALMRRLGMINRETTVFDYGCGQGHDVASLIENGYDAFGWDPHFAADGPRKEADAVNLGYVVNVIENQAERIETVRDAWGFARRTLVVSAMPWGKSPTVSLKSYKDGFLTSRGTFQKYFTQEELRSLVATATGEEPISLAPGMVAVFRDKDLEQEVSFRRRSKAAVLAERFRPPRQERSVRVVAPFVRERIASELEDIWRTALDLGRLPLAAELAEETLGGLARARVSVDRALSISCEMFDHADLDRAAEARREDLLVHFALTLFPGAPRHSTMPKSIQRDVRTFFGSHAQALEQSRAALFSVGQSGILAKAAEQAQSEGIGTVSDCYRCSTDQISRAPGPIRIVLGCAEVIASEIATSDFVEIGLEDGIVRAISCEDSSRSIPVISEIIEVDLKALRTKRRKQRDRLLYLKARYMAQDDPARPAQEVVDGKLLSSGIVSATGQGPDAGTLARLLRP
ncbi:DNA phosphorothioation-associated putative methyltransferase [Bosea sp. F3-2]|uniref:DNA phosphorothioation-associated putative methyltransferase n=1 Tax=Bosea sp. F3-2 TaxID=2599640 RepID=UPI0011EBE957|nr:DNA phosphorothioation-associated putative methyltransferase [Bosea sp. F3-2]QEL21914.1 DNA phosphorothioation-associated putative methyltransferase [Bosea sp. F3-2]